LNQPPNLFAEGLQAAERGDFARADAIARSLLARSRDDVHALQIIGYAAFLQGDNTRALDAYIRANRAAPGQPALLYWIGVLFKERGDTAQAERALRQATDIKSDYGDAWCHLGETLYLNDKKDEAAAAYEKAHAAEPQSATVLAKCARFFEINHEMDRARAFAEKAYEAAPSSDLNAIVFAEILMREKETARAIEILEPFAANDAVNRRNRSKILSLLASAYDRTARFDDAFAALEKSHALQSQISSAEAAAQQSPLQTSALDATINFLSETNFAEWTSHSALEGPAPVFLIGFVRSGTTWLDQILSSHPQIEVMEEEDNFIDIWPHYVTDAEGARRLPFLTCDEVNALRAAYWKRARLILKEDKGGPIVDKVPLNTAELGLIYRIFPDAKIIFAIRDPRDCVLSAFQQHFQINAGMAHFLDMTTAAEFYDRVMSIGEIVRNRAALDVHEIRYEGLVADLERETRALIDFLALPWDDAVLNYQETARQRAVRTPSRTQVIQKPYATSVGKWRNYRRGMAPALPILAPWVEKFGYAPD